VLPLTDNSQRFNGLVSVWVGSSDKTAGQFDIDGIRIDAKEVVIRLKAVSSRSEAEKLKNNFLFVPEMTRIKLHDGSYFVDDIFGCEVVTEDQVKIGVVADLLALPANDIWVVRNGEKEILIPAVKAIIRQVDVKKKRIIIHAMEGLLE
jgi:16S rRNA processing protein RimM